MKKEYAEKKKDVKKELKRAMKEDDKKLENIKKSGKDMIEYLQNENKKLTEKQVAMKVEYKVRPRFMEFSKCCRHTLTPSSNHTGIGETARCLDSKVR